MNSVTLELIFCTLYFIFLNLPIHGSMRNKILHLLMHREKVEVEVEVELSLKP